MPALKKVAKAAKKRPKLTALITLLLAALAGGTLDSNLFKGKCKDLVDALAEIEDESIRTAIIAKLPVSECTTDIEQFIKCRELVNGDRCINGRLYGKGKGGTEPCVPNPQDKLCLHIYGEFTDDHVRAKGQYELKPDKLLKRVEKHKDKLERALNGEP